ncbi:L-rhamnose mutarotase [Prosthecomicrobium pneumaticum]|uniref:L-rhamnose mutarotase n=1 Tax=Prosthecomicrobium pneumaticum TaxID=81895 RepID=A0A7W9FMJ0_9HYPH|nr:L-rhamnose mutarotase [Prosthecomicrobium pneumaticum]MBB5753405.1 L-rhamnose mutarotase [Prosthecomicrobium pneumaticum]
MSRDSAPGDYVQFVYHLKPGAGPEYDRRHAAVWPELLEAIGAAGIEDYRIWRHGEIVVGRMRTRHGVAAANAFMAATAIQKAWTASLLPLFERYQTEDGEPLWLDEVFRFAGAGS